MKKLLGIIVLGLLLSGNAYAEELLLKCAYTTKYDENGSSNISNYPKEYQKINLSKKFWINAKYQGKIEKSNYLTITDDYFFKYILDYTYVLEKNPTPNLTFHELNRLNGEWKYFMIIITPSEDRELKKKIDKTRNDQKKTKYVRDLIYQKVLSVGGNYPEDWRQVNLNCSKTKKKF